MVLIMLAGAAMWAYAHATAPSPTPTTDPATFTSLSSGTLGQPTPAPRTVDELAPATFRFGFAFVVGFFLAWLLRKVIKVALLLAGAIAILLIVLKQTGIIDLDFDTLQGSVEQGVGVAREKAGQFKSFVLGYLPSGASAAAGLFMGMKRAR